MDLQDIDQLADKYLSHGWADEALFFILLGGYVADTPRRHIARAANLLAQLGRQDAAADLLHGYLLDCVPGDQGSVRARLANTLDVEGEALDEILSKRAPVRPEDMFLVRENDRPSSPLAFWITPFTNNSSAEVNLTSSFLNCTEYSLLDIRTPALHGRLDMDIDRVFYAACLELKPSAVFLFTCGLSDIRDNLTPALVGYAKDKCRFSLAMIWMDMAKPMAGYMLRSIAPFADAITAVDSQVDPKVRTLYPERCIDLWPVVDEHQLADRGEERDIDVSFVGQVTGIYANRQPYIERCRAMAIRSYFGGRDFGHFLDENLYYSVMRRSKIILNFSAFSLATGWETHPGIPVALRGRQIGHHIKGRVYEILHAGAVLLQTDNPEIRRVLEEGREFVGMVAPADMEIEILKLLEDAPRRQRIARAGRERALRDFCSQPFWDAIVGRFLTLST